MNLMKTMLILTGAFSLSFSAWSQDCGWSKLSESEQSQVMAGQYIMRSEFNQDDIHFKIDQWGLAPNLSLVDTVATFFDVQAYKDVGGVADIELAEGEVAGNNPVLYVTTPKDSNPFGDLYQPFTFSSTVRKIDEAYSIQINYLTSPRLINHVFNDICFANVNGKVLIQFLSTVESNPELPISHPKFGIAARKGLWKSVFTHDVVRTAGPATAESLEILSKALEKNL